MLVGMLRHPGSLLHDVLPDSTTGGPVKRFEVSDAAWVLPFFIKSGFVEATVSAAAVAESELASSPPGRATLAAMLIAASRSPVNRPSPFAMTPM